MTLNKLINGLTVLLLFLGTFIFSTSLVSAEDALVSGNQIKYQGVTYTYKGIDNRPSSRIYGWKIYLPVGFSCGDNIIVDNPETSGTVAYRGTTASSGEASPIIGDCKTVVENVQPAIVNIDTESLCSTNNGIWTGTECNFNGVGLNLPLPSGRCYSSNGSNYNVINCPTGSSPGQNCIVTHPPASGPVQISCNTGLPLATSQGGTINCSNTVTIDCVQDDGLYRCWDGSAIAMARGSTCPVNADLVHRTICENTGGDWRLGINDTYSCFCPNNLAFDQTNGCPDPLVNNTDRQQACEGSGGVWQAQSGGTTGCSCPSSGQLNADGSCPKYDCSDPELNAKNCQIVNYLVGGINFLSAVAGLAIVASIMIAGYQYMTARDNSGQIEAAKKRIIWALVALGLFLFMYALLNFLVPGGVV
ncbi:hypothetical protein KC959_02410 [Candidatus Saccharibacteria bacterium]|nr:hypothetical protein [Candidatus Saccharibacteria bacterium]